MHIVYLEAIERLGEVVLEPLLLHPPLSLLALCPGVHLLQMLARVLGQLSRVVLDLVQLLLELLVVLGRADLRDHPLDGQHVLPDLLDVGTDVLGQPLELGLGHGGPGGRAVMGVHHGERAAF